MTESIPKDKNPIPFGKREFDVTIGEGTSLERPLSISLSILDGGIIGYTGGNFGVSAGIKVVDPATGKTIRGSYISSDVSADMVDGVIKSFENYMEKHRVTFSKGDLEKIETKIREQFDDIIKYGPEQKHKPEKQKNGGRKGWNSDDEQQASTDTDGGSVYAAYAKNAPSVREQFAMANKNSPTTAVSPSPDLSFRP